MLYGVHLAMSGIVLYGVHLAMSGISLVNIKNNEYYEKESLNSDGQQFHTLIIPTCIVYDTQGELRGNYTSALIRILIQVNYFLLIYLIFLFFVELCQILISGAKGTMEDTNYRIHGPSFEMTICFCFRSNLYYEADHFHR